MKEILVLLGANKPFDETGELTADGADKYEKLTQIVTILHEIGAIAETPDKLESYFDEICQLGF